MLIGFFIIINKNITPRYKMQELINVLNEMAQKYGISENDMAVMQEAIAKVESSDGEEFEYKEDVDISEEPEEE
jgi:membrane protein insertase Oxa1/YidC/SpoIIIJ